MRFIDRFPYLKVLIKNLNQASVDFPDGIPRFCDWGPIYRPIQRRIHPVLITQTYRLRLIGSVIHTFDPKTRTKPSWYKGLVTTAWYNGLPSVMKGCRCCSNVQIFDVKSHNTVVYKSGLGQDPKQVNLFASFAPVCLVCKSRAYAVR